MHPGEQYSSGPDLASAPGTAAPPPQLRPAVGQEDFKAPTARRWWVAAAWVGGALALFALLLRISLSFPQDSDGANNVLQAWDMLHGNLLLHGWLIGDATFYTFELPLYAVTEIFTGLQAVSIHVVSALTYVLVAASAVAVARVDSRGWSTAARCGVVIAVLAAPLLTLSGISILLEKPDHTGTAAILLVCFLLIDRAPSRRFTPPLLCAILVAGQISDATVLYVAVPAILIVWAYRVLATVNFRAGVNIRARVNLRTDDMAIAVATVLSVPLALLARAAMVRLGGFLMIPPRTGIVPIGQWGRHWLIAVHNVRTLFGTFSVGHVSTGGLVFGFACLLAAVFGFVKVLWRWRTASRAEQLLCVAIVVNITVYVISSIPTQANARELAAVLPCGAILAARALVPGRIVGVRRAQVAIAAAAAAALVPLAGAATQPTATPDAARLATWLEAHRLTYGIAGYWDASAVTVQSGGRVMVRGVTIKQFGRSVRFAASNWETKPSWYDAKHHDATFVIADLSHTYPNDDLTVAEFERYLPRPVATYQVAGRVIMIYRTNLLRYVPPALPTRTT